MARKNAPEQRQALSANTQLLNRNHNDYRGAVERNRQVLEEELYRRLDTLMTKHQTKCTYWLTQACCCPAPHPCARRRTQTSAFGMRSPVSGS